MNIIGYVHSVLCCKTENRKQRLRLCAKLPIVVIHCLYSHSFDG
uniref:Uncharacterized protein n=1 Tax=Anguilla anguilla TaxID=7936 RepID=A0A0E9TDZ1_ANGAN